MSEEVFPTITVPTDEPGSLLESVLQLKEAVELLSGQRGISEFLDGRLFEVLQALVALNARLTRLEDDFNRRFITLNRAVDSLNRPVGLSGSFQDLFRRVSDVSRSVDDIVRDIDDYITEFGAPQIVNGLPNPASWTGPTLVYDTVTGKLWELVDGQWVPVFDADAVQAEIDAAIAAGIAASNITGQLTDSQIADINAAKLTGQITGTQITDGAISTPKLAAGSVSTAKLSAGAVTADTIASNAVTAVKIQAGAVEAAKIAAGAVLAEKIAAGAVVADKIAANAVTTAKIEADAVTAGKIAAAAIAARELAAGAVVAGKIAAGAVSAAEIAANAITADKIAANAITADKIAAGAVVTNALQLDGVDADRLAIGAASVNAVRTHEVAISIPAAWTVVNSHTMLLDRPGSVLIGVNMNMAYPSGASGLSVHLFLNGVNIWAGGGSGIRLETMPSISVSWNVSAGVQTVVLEMFNHGPNPINHQVSTISIVGAKKSG